MCLLHAAFSYHLPVYVYCILLCLLLTGFIRKTYLCSADWYWLCVCFLPFDVFCFILFLLPFEHFALLITYWLLPLHTVLLIAHFLLFTTYFPPTILQTTMLTSRIILVNLHHTPYFLLSLYIYCSYFSTPFTCHSPCQLTNLKFFMIFITNVI